MHTFGSLSGVETFGLYELYAACAILFVLEAFSSVLVLLAESYLVSSATGQAKPPVALVFG